jgi:hypothetical protein
MKNLKKLKNDLKKLKIEKFDEKFKFFEKT